MNATSTSPPRRGRGRAVLIGLAVVVVAAALWAFAKPSAASRVADLPVATVEEGPLRIAVLERGNLRARNSARVRDELEGQSTILYLVPEGKSVTAGELLCELDVSSQLERRVQQKIAFDSAEASYIDAKEKFAIQQNQNESNVTRATLDVEFAGTAQKKYQEGDYPQQRQTIEAQIKIAEQEEKRVRDRLDWSRKLAEKGFLTRSELELDELALTKAQLDVQLAQRRMEVLEKYDYPTISKRQRSDYDESVRQLDRVKRRAAAEAAQAEASLKARQSTFQLERERLQKLDDQIAKAKMVAPRDGIVVYASSTGGGWRGGRDQPLAVGSTVSERTELIELPDTSTMVAELKLHESVMDHIAVGQNAIVKVDAFPERPFPAKLTYVGVVPDSQQSWMNPDLRVYRAEAELIGDTSELRPQMSCSVEIVVEDLNPSIHVPVQSVFRQGEKPVCWVIDESGEPHARPVKLGLGNERFVDVRSGLAAGERVLLALPPGLSSEISADAQRSRVGEVVKPATDVATRPADKKPVAKDAEPAPKAAPASPDASDKAGEKAAGGAPKTASIAPAAAAPSESK